VKLLGVRFSPFVLRARIALAVKGINYEFMEENQQNKSQLLLQSNPVHRKIPVLIHNGKPVCESMIIVQYIEETWDTKSSNLMPKDPYDRAIARFWATFVDDKLVPSVWGIFTTQGEEQRKAVEESVANFLLLEEALRTSSCFSEKPYFGGDEIGFVDIALGGMSGHLKALQKVTYIVLIDPEKMPLLSAWLDRFLEANVVKEVMPDPAKLLEFVSATIAGFALQPAGN